MREIKFDAFIHIKNPEDGEMEFEHLPFSELLHEGFILFKDGFLTTDKEDEYHKTIIREFTGLLDKNGKEIYEGDIIQWLTQQDSLSPTYLHTVKVEYDVDRCIWIPLGVWQRDSLNPIDGYYTCQVIKFEIIGNIYESPELLKAWR